MLIVCKHLPQIRFGFFIPVLISLVFFLSTSRANALPEPPPRLPILTNLGVIPPTIEEPEGHDPKNEDKLAQISDHFAKIVAKSARFRLINDDVVADLWKNQKGREELVSEYELHAFASLTVSVYSDTVMFTSRLSDPELKTLLQEQMRISKDELRTASIDAIDDKVESLFFSLINRIPVDANITSIQGAYVTVSAGSEQGIMLGDELDIQRNYIKSLHPANQTWLEFSAKKIGKASIIDVNSKNSVGRLTSLIDDGALEVGDGVRINNIYSRLKFSRIPKGNQLKETRDATSAIVPPVYLESQNSKFHEKESTIEQTKNLSETTLNQDQKSKSLGVNDNLAKKEISTNTDSQSFLDEGTAKAETDESKSSTSFADIFDRLKSPQDKWLDDVEILFGPHWWSVKGPANASGKFPLWLINSLGLDITRTIVYKIKVGFGGSGYFGQTTQGNYAGYDGNARLYWEDSFGNSNEFISWWRFGGYGSLNGVSVSRERFGGGDWLRGGMFAATGGKVSLVNFDSSGGSYDWFGEFAMLPLNIGRFGYSGKQYLIESAFGTRFTLGGYQHQNTGSIRWGGAIDISDDRLTLKNSRRPHLTDYRLKVLAKYSF